jgi:hypothetical protein
MAIAAAIFFTGHSSAKAGTAASRARASQNMVPAASTMCRPEIETMW